LFGTPLPDAVVEVATSKNSQKISVRTQQDGNYLLRDIPEGEVTLTVKAPGFLAENRVLFLQANDQVPLDFGLEPGRIADRPPVELNGVVQSRSKAPIKGATVTVMSAFNHRIVKTVRSDAQGRYRVGHENGGQYVVYASKPGFLVATASVVIPAAMPRKGRMNLVLHR